MGKGWEEGSSRMRGYTHTQRHTHTHKLLFFGLFRPMNLFVTAAIEN